MLTMMRLFRLMSVRPKLNILSTNMAHRNSSVDAATTERDMKLKPMSQVPGPICLPFVGSIHTTIIENMKVIDIFMEKMFDKYGPIFVMGFPFLGTMVSVKDPDDIETVFRSTMDNPIRFGFESIREMRIKELDEYFQKKIGILVTHEEEWRRVRMEVQPPLMKPTNIHHFLNPMDDVAKDFIARIEYIKDAKNEAPEDFLDEIYKWGLESVATVALNSRLGGLKNDSPLDSDPVRLVNAVKAALVGLNETEYGPPLWRLFRTKAYKDVVEAFRIFSEISEKHVQKSLNRLKTKSADEDQTLLEMLLQNPKLDYRDVLTLIVDMLAAGVDTTSSTVAFTLYSLSRNPECQRLLQQEVDDVIGDSQEPLTVSQLAKMKYLKNIVKETLRLYPIAVGNGRVLTSDVTLSGYLIPKGTMVLMCNLSTSRDEKQIKRANEYLPERWLRERPLGPIHPYATLPFSTGTRMCIGRRIAEQEIYALLIRIYQKYNVEYHYDDMKLKTRFVLQPSEPCRFRFMERHQK